ncbi:rRNA adenine N-6-methyltransferase family protein [uncultured Christiangramia sp.]|uniref:rRNA adenine N-6-methyltransferase family protein n=1 Tax=uncultured Christiangramia sp. TaxID=503836 RepID=UPI0026319C45|nr:rRNA adenine N-6-methyltransferase family protein [uncultured Christiangramia sp.]
MKKVILRFLKTIIPSNLRMQLVRKYQQEKSRISNSSLRRKIIAFYRNSSCISKEENEVICFLEKNDLQVFPYDFVFKYDKSKIRVFVDEELHLKYVMHFSKKLYFKRSLTVSAIQSLYRGLLIDQDENSPHKYLNRDFQVKPSDVVVDAGAAEGNFSLEIIERVKFIYLFECDPEWVEPLQATFAPWKEKVKIINKKIGSKNTSEEISLDTFFEKQGFTFVKADIEGDESNLLCGASNILAQDISLKLVLCTYHKQNDYVNFRELLSENEFRTTSTNGFIIFFYDKWIKPPYLRKALIRAERDVG